MTWAVVGAGYSGVAVAAALLESGLEVDVLDGRGAVGGLWRDGVYDDVRLITTRRVTAFPSYPMPSGDLFPTGPELLAYLEDVAVRTGVTSRLQHRCVSSVTPFGDGWDVDGRSYDGVVLCTGMFSRPRVPALPGSLTVPQLHTAAYKRVDQLGDDVLVVGLGNSGADVAAACAASGRRVTMAVAESRHVVPKEVLGKPLVEMHRPPRYPDLPVRLGLDLLLRATTVSQRSGRLPEPRHLVLSQSPVVHSTLLGLIGDGSISVRPGAVRLEGARVHFSDGTSGVYDTVVWATGYDYVLPVARPLLDGSSVPYGRTPLSLVGGAWSPYSRGLAAVGHREPRHGRGPYLAAVARAVAAGAVAQARTPMPIGKVLSRTVRPSAEELVDDGPELRRLAALVKAAARV